MRVNHAHQAELVTPVRTGLAQAQEAPVTSFAATLAQTGTTGGTAGSNTASGTGKADGEHASRRVIPKPPKGETTRAVPDHPAYVEVTSGPRNGMFINRTDNVRSGEAFVLARRGDHDLHIYGTGKDRRVIISWHKDQPAHREDTTPAAGTTDSTGGATAA